MTLPIRIILNNVRVAFLKHVKVTCCRLTFQIVTFTNIKQTFMKHVTVAQCKNVQSAIVELTFTNVSVTLTFLSVYACIKRSSSKCTCFILKPLGYIEITQWFQLTHAIIYTDILIHISLLFLCKLKYICYFTFSEIIIFFKETQMLTYNTRYLK